MKDDLLSVRLKSISFETGDISSFILVAPDGSRLPLLTAGAHIDLHLGGGLIRSYSLLNDPSERHRYVIAVKREPEGRGGSAAIHDHLKVGDILSISQPRNNFPFHEEVQHSVFIAGGIGITPILSMARRASALGRDWELHYVTRTRAHAAFLAELEQLRSRSNGKLHVVHDQESGAVMVDIAKLVADAPPDAHLYCCGPLQMLDAFERAAKSRPAGTTHVEYFIAREAPSTAGGFEVRLARSNRTVAIEPGKTILDALLDAGVPVAYSCSEGICGTCEAVVIEGIPDHRDLYLSDEEKAANRQIMICCSGSKSPVLVLDL